MEERQRGREMRTGGGESQKLKQRFSLTAKSRANHFKKSRIESRVFVLKRETENSRLERIK